jgi:hypothetical protein
MYRMNGRFPWPIQDEATLTFSVLGMEHSVMCLCLLFGCLPSIQFADIQFIFFHLLYFWLDLYLHLTSFPTSQPEHWGSSTSHPYWLSTLSIHLFYASSIPI